MISKYSNLGKETKFLQYYCTSLGTSNYEKKFYLNQSPSILYMIHPYSNTHRRFELEQTWCWARSSSSLINCLTISSVNLLKESSPINEPRSSIEYRGVAGATEKTRISVRKPYLKLNFYGLLICHLYYSDIKSDEHLTEVKLFIPDTLPSSEVTDTLSNCFLARLRWLSEGRIERKLRSISSSVIVSSSV